MTRLLVLGGSAFVGHALVTNGRARGWEVTTFNRGRAVPEVGDGVHRLHGDRTDPSSLGVLSKGSWDVVADTWSGAPRAVRDCARVLAGRVGHYVYVSSGSVYPPPLAVGVGESAAVLDGSPDDAEDGDYARAKRGGELAAEQGFGERALLARCGLILGPREDIGRLPWWLARMSRGGDVLAPGPPERPLAYVDVRDLARFLLDGALAGLFGPCNVVSRRGHATMASLLEACREVIVPGADEVRLCWTTPAVIATAGIEPWSELPVWLPPDTDYEGLHGMDVERAHAAGLNCRPVAETVADTWAWMQTLPGSPPLRDGVPAPGVTPERERAALDAAGF